MSRSSHEPKRGPQMDIIFLKQMTATVLLCAVGIKVATGSKPSVKIDKPRTKSQIEAEHDVGTTELFNEIYDIDVFWVMS